MKEPKEPKELKDHIGKGKENENLSNSVSDLKSSGIFHTKEEWDKFKEQMDKQFEQPKLIGLGESTGFSSSLENRLLSKLKPNESIEPKRDNKIMRDKSPSLNLQELGLTKSLSEIVTNKDSTVTVTNEDEQAYLNARNYVESRIIK